MDALPRIYNSAYFPDLIENNAVYVDKTELIYQLCTERHYSFLHRPRSFGTSTLLSTIEMLYQGKKELFEGLWIHDRWDWERKHPVLRLCLTSFSYGEPLDEELSYLIESQASRRGITLKSNTYFDRTKELIRAMSKEGKVVVLIDEYLYPLLNVLPADAKTVQDTYRTLRNFFFALEACSEHVEFALMAGLGNIQMSTCFVGLDHFIDISSWRSFATLLGVTQQELEHYFMPHLQAIATRKQVPLSEVLEMVSKRYGGYRFEEDAPALYPTRGLCFYLKGSEAPWISTGTPSFLIRQLKKYGPQPVKEGGFRVGHSVRQGIEWDVEPGRYPYISMLLQTGYLSIMPATEASRRSRTLLLDFPNEDTRSCFKAHLEDIYRG